MLELTLRQGRPTGKKETMSLSAEEMNKQLPAANTLPGEAVPYYMETAAGARYKINGQLVSVTDL